MALIPGKIANELYAFVQQQNLSPQGDVSAAQQAFCRKIEEMIYQSIRDATYQILPGVAIVAGPPAGPMVNPSPISVTVV